MTCELFLYSLISGYIRKMWHLFSVSISFHVYVNGCYNDLRLNVLGAIDGKISKGYQVANSNNRFVKHCHQRLLIQLKFLLDII